MRKTPSFIFTLLVAVIVFIFLIALVACAAVSTFGHFSAGSLCCR